MIRNSSGLAIDFASKFDRKSFALPGPRSMQKKEQRNGRARTAIEHAQIPADKNHRR